MLTHHVRPSLDVSGPTQRNPAGHGLFLLDDLIISRRRIIGGYCNTKTNATINNLSNDQKLLLRGSCLTTVVVLIDT